MTEPQLSQSEAGRRLVLVVDDDPIIRELIREQLALIGLDCVCAEHGEAACDVIAKQPFHLALIDLSMPKLDGFGLLRHIRQHPKVVDLPVIVVTSYNDRESIDRAYELGASSFVTKPVNWAQFAHHIQFVMRNGETEHALRTAKAEALAASRMKNGLFHVLSHELKTPLTALIGITDLIATSMQDRTTSEETEHLEHVIGAAQRLNAIIGDVLVLSRALGSPAQIKLSTATAGELVDEALAGLKSKARERDVAFLIRPFDKNLLVDCDQHLVQHALKRLIDNAVKFSPPGSTVEIWATERSGRSAMISVRDTGPGIGQIKLRECLQPFVQEDMSYGRSIEGLGLGLPIAKAICEAHGGELLIETAPGKGLTAAICLPAAARAMAA